jgi:copper(I)-binding protein
LVSISSVALALAIAGCAAEQRQATTSEIEVSHVYVTEPAMGERAALYFTVTNLTANEDELTTVSTPVAEAVEIHKTVEEAGRVVMEPIRSVTLPPKGELRFAPGGYHVMLIGLLESFAPGDYVDATLHFRDAGAIAVRGEVLRYVDIERAFTETQ